jgi:short-subunit dehydrogenase
MNTLDITSVLPGRTKRASIRRISAGIRPPLDGGTILITGATAGIGREIALQLAPRAGTLVLVARRAGRLEELRAQLAEWHEGLRVVAEPGDLADESDVERILTRVQGQVGNIDVLINNAGVGDVALFDQAPWTRTRQVLVTNVLALAQLTAALVPAMVARGRGGVLNLGSMRGLALLPSAVAYAASKHFVDGFSEALRADLAGTGVVVTQVCPGPVDSEFDAAAGATGGPSGGPLQLVRISAERCAREALAGFDRGVPLVLPGCRYRLLIRLVRVLPRETLRRRACRRAAQLRMDGNATCSSVITSSPRRP